MEKEEENTQQQNPVPSDRNETQNESSIEKLNKNTPGVEDTPFDENGKPSDGLKLTMDSEKRLKAEEIAKAEYESKDNEISWNQIDGKLRESLIDEAFEKLK